MFGKYLPIPAQHGGNNIDTPARFRAWLRYKYHELTQGSQGASISKLATEKFLPNDTPESYEDRIRLLLLNTANNNADACALLWNHLPDELFNRVKSARPNANDIDAFFEAVRNCYLERKPSTFTYSNNNTITALSNIVANPSYQQPNMALNKAMDHIEITAMRLGYPDNASRKISDMQGFIDDELEKLGLNIERVESRGFVSRSGYGMKRSKKKPPASKKPKKIVRHCGNCGMPGHTRNICKRKIKKMNYGYIEECKDDQYEECEDDQYEEEVEREEYEEEEEPEEYSEEEYETMSFNAGKKKVQNGSLLLLGDQGYQWN
jgi:hypothetical protein